VYSTETNEDSGADDDNSGNKENVVLCSVRYPLYNALSTSEVI
jgi:hypothetical protein